MRHLLSLGALAALIVAGCTSSEPASDKAGRADMVKILDAVQAAVQAKRMDDLAWYDSENLYEYIDGDAARFTDTGFARLVHSEWQAPGAKGNAYVELDLYDMATPLGAIDILCDSRIPETVYLPYGNEAQQGDQGIELRVGRYYVRLVARKDIEGQKEFLKALAAAVTKAAPIGPSDQELVAPLPSANLVPHTASYVAKAYLGREFLGRVREATYEVHGKRVRLFLMDAGRPDDARKVLAEWKESLPPQPIGAQEMPNQISYTEEYVGPVTATCEGKWVTGAIGDPKTGQALLESLKKRLEQ